MYSEDDDEFACARRCNWLVFGRHTRVVNVRTVLTEEITGKQYLVLTFFAGGRIEFLTDVITDRNTDSRPLVHRDRTWMYDRPSRRIPLGHNVLTHTPARVFFRNKLVWAHTKIRCEITLNTHSIRYVSVCVNCFIFWFFFAATLIWELWKPRGKRCRAPHIWQHYIPNCTLTPRVSVCVFRIHALFIMFFTPSIRVKGVRPRQLCQSHGWRPIIGGLYYRRNGHGEK